MAHDAILSVYDRKIRMISAVLISSPARPLNHHMASSLAAVDYNQGGPNPWDGKPDGPWNAQGWAPGSSSNPNQNPSDLGHNPFPRDVGLEATSTYASDRAWPALYPSHNLPSASALALLA